MAQGSFSQQRTEANQPQQSRVTRTQRVISAQEEKKKKYQFAQARAEANRLKTSVFIDKENDPFTFEEYSQEYKKLSPNVQQFFQSPTEITTKKDIQIAIEKQKVEAKIQTYQKQHSDAQARLNEFNIYKRNYNYSSDPATRKEQKEGQKRDRDEFSNDIKEAKARLRYLGGQAGRVSEGIKASDLINYAEDRANYDRDRWDSKDKSQYKFKSDLDKGNLDSVLKTVGIAKKDVSYQSYNRSVEAFNQKARYAKSLQTWAGKVGFENLPARIQQKVNPTAIEFQKTYPTEKLTFDKMGNVTSVESGAFGETLPIAQYNKRVKTQQDRIKEVGQDQFEREWREKQYDELEAKKKKDEKVLYDISGFETVTRTDTPFLFDQGTINPDQQVILTTDKEKPKGVVSYVFGVVAETPIVKQGIKGAKMVDEVVHWDIKNMPTTLGVSFGKKDKPTVMERVWNEGQENLQKASVKLENFAIGKEKIEKFKADKETKYEEIYQSAFEKAELKNMMVDQVPFDVASERFKQSDEAKKIQADYLKEYKSDYKELITVTNDPTKQEFWTGRVVGGIGQTGLSIASLGLTVTKTPMRTLATIGTVYGGTAVLGAVVPTTAKLGVSATFFAKGTYDFVAPTSTYKKAGAGLTTAIISGGTLGYSAYRYLKSPVVTTAKIKAPKGSYKASQIIGKDFTKSIGADGKTMNKVIYGQQKLSQTGVAGRRTIVTTQGRVLSNKYLHTNLKPIYQGIPANQPATFMRATGLRGSYLIKTAPSGYEKATTLLKKYGYSSYEAKSTLRYYAPKHINQFLEKGMIHIGGQNAKAEFTFTQKQPVIKFTQDGLKLKTRGAKVIQNKYAIDRKLVTINEKQFVVENKLRVGSYLDKQGKIFRLKDFEFSQTKNIVKVSDTKKGIEYLGKQGGIDIYKDPAQFKDIISFSKNNWAMTVTPKRTQTIIDIVKNQNLGATKSTLYDWNVDLSKTGSQKPLFTFTKSGSSAWTDTGTTTTTGNAKKAIAKIINPTKSTLKGITVQNQLKTIVTPQDIQVTKVGTISSVKVNSLSALTVGQTLAVASQFKLKTKTKTVQNIKLKSMLRSMNLTKTGQLQIPQLKSSPSTKTNQTQSFALAPALTGMDIWKGTKISTPTAIKTPTYIPPVIFAVQKKLQKKKRLRRDKLTPEMLGILPDFTSKAIGLKPQEFGSAKDVIKQMKKFQTGFEIRRGARLKKVKKNVGVSENQLLKGIMR